MAAEAGAAPGSPPSRLPPGKPQGGAQPLPPVPGSDSRQPSGFSDSGWEQLGTETAEPPGPEPQPPRTPPPLLLLPVAVADTEGVSRPELSPCRRGSSGGGALLAALALRTGALLRRNRRTQGDIATLRRHTRLLARAARQPSLWPRLRHLLGPSGGRNPAHVAT